jgi:hypothetical protein
VHVRVDSRLDFYTKALALAGLGLLGVIGALVDYWPGDLKLPRVNPVVARRATPVVQTAFDVPGLTASPLAVLRAEWANSGPRAQAIRAREIRAVETQMSAVAALTVLSTAHDELPSTVPLPIRAIELEATIVELTPPPSIAAPIALAPAPTLVASVQPDDGFLSGMLKKTGSSVGTSIGRASNSLVGAVKAVGDVVKRAF